MATKKHSGMCNFEQAKRGNYEACTRQGCKERIPCLGNSCGHMDCIEHRGKLPLCHYCKKQVVGEKHDLWTPWLVHGHDRAVHYSCRDQHASPLERQRWGTL